jgi:coenzyme F420-reducing hydrogenase alpha subunit
VKRQAHPRRGIWSQTRVSLRDFLNTRPKISRPHAGQQTNGFRGDHVEAHQLACSNIRAIEVCSALAALVLLLRNLDDETVRFEHTSQGLRSGVTRRDGR